MSASWGDRMWEVTSVESFVVGVRMRSDSQLTFKLKRFVPLTVYSGQVPSVPSYLSLNHVPYFYLSQVAGRQQRLMIKRDLDRASNGESFSTSSNNNVYSEQGRQGEARPDSNSSSSFAGESGGAVGLLARVDKIKTQADLSRFWSQYKALYYSGKLRPTMSSVNEYHRKNDLFC